MQRHWKLRFGVGVLLFSMLVVAGYFYGLNRGDTVRYNTTLSTKVYSLSPLLNADQPVDEQLETIAKLIRESIAPDSWVERGGTATLTVYDSNRSFVVYQYGTEHDKIEDLLASVEKLANDKMRRVEYDVSSIINGSSKKPVDEQLDAICALTTECLSDLGAQSVRLTPDPENETIVVAARGQMHSALAAYFEQLRHARKAISEIDA